jgi:phospholipid/cholesterol/gamma-HCH transport system substrate-binding protein
MRKLANSFERNTGEMTRAAIRTGATLDTLGRRLDGPGTMGQLMRDPALYNRATSAVARLDSLMGEAAAGRGTLGKLARDEQLYNEAQAMIRDMRRLLQDMQANPSRYIKISVF